MQNRMQRRLGQLTGTCFQRCVGMDALNALYPRLASGGFAIIDDYGALQACSAAVHDYRAAHAIDAPIYEIDWTGAFWRKP